MQFYRNLGAISYAAETQFMEIFSVHPNSCLFQFKDSNIATNLLYEVEELYALHYRGEQFIKVYTQKNKPASILIFGISSQPSFVSLPVDQLCSLIRKTIQTIKFIDLPNRIGQITENQFFIVNGEIRFVYLPLWQSEARGTQIIDKILKWINRIKNDKEVSHRLLVKKLGKCTTLEQLQEETNYFDKVYSVKKTAIKSLPMQNQRIIMQKEPLKMIKTKIPVKSHRKYNLFKMTSPSSYSQPRRSSSAVHINILGKNRKNSALTSTSFSCRKSKDKSLNKKNNTFSQFADFKNSQNSFYHKPAKRSINKQITQIMSEESFHSKGSKHQSPSKKPSKHNVSSNSSLIINRMQTTNSSHQSKQRKKEQFDDKNWVDQIYSSNFGNLNKQNVKKPNQAKQNEHHDQTDKKLKKSAFTKYKEDSCIDQIQEINFHSNKKQPPKKEQIRNQEVAKPPSVKKITRDMITKINFSEPSSFVSESLSKKPSQQPTPIGSRSPGVGQSQSITLRKSTASTRFLQLKSKLEQLDFIGVAVANTAAHLKKFQEMFWHLPMFFIYRHFFYCRLMAAEEAKAIGQEASSLFNQLSKENSQIQMSVKKLLKKVHSLIKKHSNQDYNDILGYLNLDFSINTNQTCTYLMKQYMASLFEATSSYPQLIPHQIQIMDAFFIVAGQKIEIQKRKEAFINDHNCEKYYLACVKKLKKMLSIK